MIGGLLADRFGLEAPFYVVAAATIAASLYALFRLEETRPAARSPSPIRGGRLGCAAAHLTAFVAVLLANLAVFLTRHDQNTLLPLPRR